ncbi:hypothetical protein ACFX14_036127 [Malus domestica]
MNCPYHILVYKRKPHSYHEFPIRIAELGAVYRYELSGSLHGLFRDDAHIFCKYEVNLSTRPEKAVGDVDIWVKP